MAKSETQIDRLVKPLLRKLHTGLSKIQADAPELGGSPAEPSTFEPSEPVELNNVNEYEEKYGEKILSADTWEAFSILITEIASLEKLNVNTDLEEIAKVANLIRQKHGLEPQ